jgi:hypothetical protein
VPISDNSELISQWATALTLLKNIYTKPPSDHQSSTGNNSGFIQRRFSDEVCSMEILTDK